MVINEEVTFVISMLRTAGFQEVPLETRTISKLSLRHAYGTHKAGNHGVLLRSMAVTRCITMDSKTWDTWDLFGFRKQVMAPNGLH